MSIKQMITVFNDETLKGNEKLLMLAIADNANDTGVCFPSWNELIRKTSMSKGSISKWFTVLEEKGLLFRKSRNRKNGSRTSNKFLIYPHQNKENLDEEDKLIFEYLFIQSSEVEPSDRVQELNRGCSEVELHKGGQSSEVEHLEPSLILNRQSNRHLYVEIISHLNQTLKTNFQPNSQKTKSLINARLKEGFTKEDFFRVHMIKFAEWANDAKMKAYLRPETLYGTKFESYLNQQLSDYQKMQAISEHTGMSALEILREQGFAG